MSDIPATEPSDTAMRAAVEIELMNTCGPYATVAYAKMIQRYIDEAKLIDRISALSKDTTQ